LSEDDDLRPQPVLFETLRQLCLFELLSARGQQSLWWSYANAFSQFCRQDGSSPYDFTSQCADRQLAVLPLSSDAISYVHSCAAPLNNADCSSLPPSTLIPLFEYQISNASALSSLGTAALTMIPTVFVNDEAYRGSLSCPNPIHLEQCNILQAVCAGFASPPSSGVCTPNGCELGVAKDDCGVCGGSNSCKGVSTGVVVALVMVLLVAVLAVAVVWRRWHKQQVKMDLDHILAQYAHIDPEAGAAVRQEKSLGPLAARREEGLQTCSGSVNTSRAAGPAEEEELRHSDRDSLLDS